MGLAFSRIWERMFGKKEMRSLQCINQIVATRVMRLQLIGVGLSPFDLVSTAAFSREST